VSGCVEENLGSQVQKFLGFSSLYQEARQAKSVICSKGWWGLIGSRISSAVFNVVDKCSPGKVKVPGRSMCRPNEGGG
jgi:hypothetical protein